MSSWSSRGFRQRVLFRRVTGNPEITKWSTGAGGARGDAPRADLGSLSGRCGSPRGFEASAAYVGAM